MIESVSPENLLYIILGIVTFDFLFERFLDYVNHKAIRTEIPSDVASFYDKEKYEKSLRYHKELDSFSFYTSVFSFILSFVMLYFGLFGWLNNQIAPYIDNEVFRALAYFTILFIASDILNIPFQLYSTFVIEEKFGFNKTTFKTFFLDKIKGYVLSALIGGALLGLFFYLVFEIGEGFWVYFWAVASIMILLVNMFYTSLILPIFNKLTPLENGELKAAIQEYSRKVGFPLDNIFVIDGSKRSKKANAFFSGIGKKKKIVLYDTLIENHSKDELVAVLAHEVGHFKKKHIVQGFIMSIAQIGFMLFILSQMIFSETLSTALGAQDMVVHINLIAFGILYSPISKILGVVGNIISRKNEYEADNFAATTFGGRPLKDALKRLSVDNLSNLYPHPAYVFFHYSHPPLLKRLQAMPD